MSTPERGYNINQTFIIDTNEGDSVLSACTALFTANIYACSGNTQILLGTSSIDMVGDLFVDGNLSATTISATTFYGDGSNLTGISTQDTFITGGTYSNGVATFTNNTGGTFSVSGFSTGYTLTSSAITSTLGYVPLSSYTDTFVTGGTYLTSASTLTFTNNTGGTFSISGITTSTAFTGGTVTGATNFTGGLIATTISATTYQNLPTDIRVTGGTYSDGTATFTNNTGGTFNINGFYTGATDVFVTGATYNNANQFSFTNNTGGTFNVSFNQVTGLTATTLSATTYQNLPSSVDTFVTGFTYSSNTFTLNRNQSLPNLTATINSVTGLTINGSLLSNSISATTISGGTFFGNGSGLTGISASASITVGSTPILSGTNGRIAFNNSGVYGESNALKFYQHTAGYGQTLRVGDGAATSGIPFMARNSTWSTNFTVYQNNSRNSGAIGFYNDALTAAQRFSILYRTELSIMDENSGNFPFYCSTSDIRLGFSTSIGTGVAPTARLHIAAGSTAALSAPIKINSGSLMITPETGTLEYNNTFHVTNSDSTRRHIVTAPNTTKVTAGAPYTNDGYIIVNIGGTDFKLMTTS